MNQTPVRIRAKARRDLEAHYRYLYDEVDAETADRFLNAADLEFHKLAREPGLGPAVELDHTRLKRLRKWRVTGFPKFLIFYEPRAGGVSVVRVCHAAQDWWGLLGVG